MEINELLDLLELDSIDEFSHFEDLAALLECDQVISFEAFHEILAYASRDNLIELINGYFDDITENLPGDNIELFTLLSTISKMFIGLLENENENEQSTKRNMFIDELYRFKTWYTFGPEVECISTETGEELKVSLCDAIYMYRLEKLNGEVYRYDCSDCLDYELEEYTLGFSATIETEELSHKEERYDDSLDESSEYLIDSEFPVIDGEFEDEIEDEIEEI